MRNLIKNVLRSFKNNKISIVGLVLLLFFGLGVFCVMTNTTSNITNEYTSLANKGKLHDFTAAEMYEIGNASYTPEDYGISYQVSGEQPGNFELINNLSSLGVTTSSLYTGKEFPTTSGTYYVVLPHVSHIDGTETYITTYHITLDEETSTGLYQQFAKAKAGSWLADFNIKITRTFESGTEDPIKDRLYFLWQQQEAETPYSNLEQLAEDNLLSTDYQTFTNELNKQTQAIQSVVTTTDTPLANELASNYAKEVEYRPFKSINVTATKDNIFYKIIDSNPADTIDKMVMFSDPSGRKGNNVFNVTDWAPYGSELTIYDLDNNVIEPLTPFDTPSGSFIVPSDFNDVAQIPLFNPEEVRQWDDTPQNRLAKLAYTQILQIRFKRMLAGDRSTNSLDSTLALLAATNLDHSKYGVELLEPGSAINNAYLEYLTYWYNNESITISSNGNVVFGWVETLGTPQTCTISNWTSRFSVVNPQHLQKNSKRVLSPSLLNGFKPFIEWYKAVYQSSPSGEIKQDVAAAWFNSLNQNQFGFWIDPSTKEEWNYMDYSIPGKEEPVRIERKDWNGIDKQYIADCGGYNQIIWGCGLTPDFMYPVVDISRPTPNTKTECLVYCNEAGYYTIRLAFINSPTEEYLIARFKPNVNTNRQKEIVNEVNKWAKDHMIFPKDVNCAYFADDTNNILNCSGFRVAYLPRLVNVVKVVSTILCTFIGILCLVICFVIIKRYVERNRVNIGIMRANGIKKWKIAVSLLPFAFIPALIGGIAAYLTGLGLQAGALSLFSDYWMLPTPLIKFNWISFFGAIFIPFIVFSAICWITTLIVLRVNSVELMKPGSEFKTNSFSRVVKKPFKHFGVLTRFRVALAFNSISRLLMLAAMSCLTMSSLVFAMTTFDKLNKSHELNSTQFDYSFNVELTTPTTSGSVYSTYDYSQLQEDPQKVTGIGWSDPTQYIFNTAWNTSDPETGTLSTKPEWYTPDGELSYQQLTKPYSRNLIYTLLGGSYRNVIGHTGNLMLPTAADATGQNQDLLYLQNKFCSRLTLDYNIGLPGIAASNPWEIALALMPANSRNIAADSFNQIINYVGHKVHDAHEQFVQAIESLGITINPKTGRIEYASNLTGVIHEVARQIGKWYGLGVHYETIPYVDPAYWYSQFPQFFNYDSDSDTYSLKTSIEDVGYLYMAFNIDFINLIKTIYTDADTIKMEYPITYGNIPLNWNVKSDDKKDETYTYVSGNITALSNKSDFDDAQTIKIEGIAKDSQYIKLTNKDGKSINDWLFDQNYLNSLNIDKDTYPVIANAYAAHKYKLNIGDTITINVTNSADRFEQQLHPNLYDKDYNKVTFKVIGLSQGTNGDAFYTTQFNANNILGLPNGQTWNKTHKYMMWTNISPDWLDEWAEWDEQDPLLADLSGIGANDSNHIAKYTFSRNPSSPRPILDSNTAKLTSELIQPPVGFNGIYTENKTGKPITAGLSLYSCTGMYPGASVYTSDGTNNKFADILRFGNNLAIANLMSGVNEERFYRANAAYVANPTTETLSALNAAIEEFITIVHRVYGDTTMITAITGAMDVAASDLIYSNLISTFDLAETSIMAIIIPITIIIVAIISNLIIVDSKRMAAMLKALGYSDAKNLMSILALFVPTIVLGLGLAVPLSLGLTLGYQAIIFNTANILVDVTQKWWFYVAAIGGIGIILVGSYAVGFVSLKRDRLVDQIK